MGLHNRKFTTGTIIKLYSYHLPKGSRSVISRDLNQSINEYLFNPALPILTVDNAKRYPKDRNLQRDLYGLKRRLEEQGDKYVEERFSERRNDHSIGDIVVTCYVFKPRLGDRTVRSTRESIRREFFKSRMSVLFSLNGQVHGHYTSEFITRTLKFTLLRDYVLIHVDCSNVRAEFRDELFMASRDRLKASKESRQLREVLKELLANGRLKDIYKQRKASITVESSDAEDLVRNLTRNLPIRTELARLLGNTFKLHDNRKGQKNKTGQKRRRKGQGRNRTFLSQRYPSQFKVDLKTKDREIIPMVQVPRGSERTIKFITDVEDNYFDRVDDPGELQIALLGLSNNKRTGGGHVGEPKRIHSVLNVVKSSPSNGTIRIKVKPTEEVSVGDTIKVRAALSSPDSNLEQIFMVKVEDARKKPKVSKKGDEPDTTLGLPKLVMVYKGSTANDSATGHQLTWDRLEQSGISMNHDTVVSPHLEGDQLTEVYINMDSKALLSYRSKLTRAKSVEIANKRYVSAVYFHTLFLYTITKNRNYNLSRTANNQEQEVDITEYISDLFGTFYAQFLLSFDTQELISAIEF